MRLNGPTSPSTNAPAPKGPDENGRIERLSPQDTQEAGADVQQSSSSGDQVEISAEAAAQARHLAETEQTSGADEIRADKVEAAKKFLAAGLYNDKGVIEETASKMQTLM